MVLQQKGKAPIWGWATPGQTVVVETGWTRTSYKTVAGKDGAWKIAIPTPKADNRPYDLTVKAGADFKAFHDVVLGEVWLCSGQSNMEWQMAQSNAPGEVAMADYPMIRSVKVTKAMMPTPQTTSTGNWETCTPFTTNGFTAVGFYFGKRLHNELHVPIGLINSTWGGTEAELWTSREKILTLPEQSESLRARERVAAAYPALWRSYMNQQMLVDKGYGSYMNFDKDDSDWQSVTDGDWAKNGLADFHGVAWFRGTFELSAAQAKQLQLGAVDDTDETYINGVQVGSTDGWDQPRKYAVPAGTLKPGKNVITVRVVNPFGGGGFNFKSVTLDGKPVNASWRMKKGPSVEQLPVAPQNSSGGSGLFNGMINPLIPYSIKGAIWYQGESNVSRARQYEQMFPAMIQDWRERWNSNFPFYFVQIAPFIYNAGTASAELREAQRLSLRLPNTGMAVVADAVESVRDIHPKNKEVPGERLARWALHNDYGFKNLEVSGPLPASWQPHGSQFVVKFSHAAGLKPGRDGNGTLGGFQVAGADGVFHAATATIQGSNVVLTCASVQAPVAARYAWSEEFPPISQMLYNAAGLPASSFRTDNFRLQTQDIKW